MDTQPEVKWGRGVDFAEVAEAVGCPTDEVMAFYRDTVLWSPPGDDETPIFATRVTRDAAGILQTTITWELCTVGEFHSRMRALLEGGD